jgi:hypothetical protein
MERNLDTIHISGFDVEDAGVVELDKVPKVDGVLCQG